MPAAKAPRATDAARKFLDGRLIVPSASIFAEYMCMLVCCDRTTGQLVGHCHCLVKETLGFWVASHEFEAV